MSVSYPHEGSVDPRAIDRASAAISLASQKIGTDAAKRDAVRDVVKMQNAARTSADFEAVAKRAEAVT